jgi:glutamate:GABA antiporter
LSAPVTPDESPNRPQRVLGFRDLFFFYVVTGISLRWIAAAAVAGPKSIIIWLAAWLFFYVPLALSVIELSSRFPDEGGLYVWTKQAFGEFPGFLCGWIYWTSYFPYLPAALYFAAGNALYICYGSWGHYSQHAGYYIIFSLITLALVTWINLAGLSVGRWLHDAGALAMWIPAGIIFVMGVIAWQRFGSANSFDLHSMLPTLHSKDMMFWSLLIFAFGGSEAASFMGAEIKGTKRTVPTALLSGGFTVALCYIFGTLGVLLALPATEVSNLQGLMQAVMRTAERVGLNHVIPVTAFLIALSTVAAVSAFLAASARLPFVAGLDRILPSVFGKLHPKWGTPWIALLVESGVGAIFLFLGQFQASVKGAYEVLITLGVITYFIPYMFLFASLLKLQSQPAGESVIRIPGGRWVGRMVAGVGLMVAAAAIVLSLIPSSDEPHTWLAIVKAVGISVALLAIGTAIYWAGKRRDRLSA